METNLQTGLVHNHASLVLEPYDITYSDANDESSPMSEPMGLSSDSKKINKKRNKYQRIDDNLRQKLIDAVVQDGQMLKVAAKKLKINYSSAKSIFHTFRKEGRVNKKTVRDRYGKTIVVESTKENNTKKSHVSSSNQTSKTTTVKQKEEKSAYVQIPHKTLPEEKLAFDPKLCIKDYVLPQTPGLTLQSLQSLQANQMLPNPIAMQNQSVMQHLMQRAASMKLLQDFQQMQSTINPYLPLAANNFQLNSSPIGVPSYSAIMALQAAQLNQYTKERQKLLYNSMPVLQGYQDAENKFSVNTN